MRLVTVNNTNLFKQVDFLSLRQIEDVNFEEFFKKIKSKKNLKKQ